LKELLESEISIQKITSANKSYPPAHGTIKMGDFPINHQGRIYGTGMPVPLHVFLLEPGANDSMCQFHMNLK
jgi:hypothetical protein